METTANVTVDGLELEEVGIFVTQEVMMQGVMYRQRGQYRWEKIPYKNTGINEKKGEQEYRRQKSEADRGNGWTS